MTYGLPRSVSPNTSEPRHQIISTDTNRTRWDIDRYQVTEDRNRKRRKHMARGTCGQKKRRSSDRLLIVTSIWRHTTESVLARRPVKQIETEAEGNISALESSLVDVLKGRYLNWRKEWMKEWMKGWMKDWFSQNYSALSAYVFHSNRRYII